MAASLLALSCSRAEMDLPEPGNGSDLAIRLGVKSAEAVLTRATAPGDSLFAANENKVYTLDYFLYFKDPSANADEEAFLQGRLTFDGEGIEPVTDAIARENATVIELKDYYSDESEDKTCYVYVIANLPSTFTRNEDGDLLSGDTVLGTKWADLQAIEIASDFKNSLQDGKFKPQDSFVMAGLKSQTLSGRGADEVIVDLARIASKVSLDLNVVKLFDKYNYNTVLGDYAYQGSYLPNVDAIQIYLTYVDESGLISGEPASYDNSFFTYNRYAFVPNEIEERTFTSKILARDSEGAIITDDQGNPTYTDSDPYPAFGVTGSPFYSYPIKWNSTDTHAPFIKIIIPWVKYSVPDNVRNAYTTFNETTHTVNLDPTNDAYLAVIDAVMDSSEDFPLTTTMTLEGTDYTLNRLTTQAAMTSRNGDEFYYKISIPTEEYELDSNNWYMIKLDISVLGSESDDASVWINGSTMGIFVIDWSTPNDDLGGDLDGGRFLSTAQNEYVINAIDDITVPVISSHTLAARIVSAQRWINGAWQNVSRGTVTPSGTNQVKLVNSLDNTMGTSLDCYPFKFVVEISQVNSDGTTAGSLSKEITIYQYPSIYVDGIAGGNVFIDGYYGNVNGNYHNYNPGGNVATGYVYTPYAPLARTVSATDQTDMTVISISSLGSNNTFTLREYSGNQYSDNSYSYLLIDPRELAGYGATDLIAYYNGSGTTNWTNAQANPIKVSSTLEKGYIAPKFMISSRWGRMSNWQPGNMSDDDRFETVQKRCATYQEAGYPAGRWRLPTPAEIAFIANLQRYDLINDLFTAQGYSISATGDVFTVSGNNVNVNQNRGTSCRCVYDLWYWGDEPVSGAASTYTIAPNAL